MRKVFVVEVLSEALDNPIVWYLNSDGCLKDTPEFIIDEKELKKIVVKYFSGFSTLSKESIDKVSGAVIEIKNLQQGLRNCTATRLDLKDFYRQCEPILGDDYNVQWKLQLQDLSSDKVTFVGRKTKSPFGQSWSTASGLRDFLALNASKLMSEFSNAKVLRIVYEDDFITPKSVIEYDVVNFFTSTDAGSMLYSQLLAVKDKLEVRDSIEKICSRNLSNPMTVEYLK